MPHATPSAYPIAKQYAVLNALPRFCSAAAL